MGSKEKLQLWGDASKCELLCPTNAIKVTTDAILIEEKGCIACGLCVEFSPEGMLEFASSREEN